MLGLHSTGQPTLDRRYIRATKRWAAPSTARASCWHQKGDQQAEVREAVATTRLSAAEKGSWVFTGSHPRPPNTLAEASAWMCAPKRGV